MTAPLTAQALHTSLVPASPPRLGDMREKGAGWNGAAGRGREPGGVAGAGPGREPGGAALSMIWCCWRILWSCGCRDGRAAVMVPVRYPWRFRYPSKDGEHDRGS